MSDNLKYVDTEVLLDVAAKHLEGCRADFKHIYDLVWEQIQILDDELEFIKEWKEARDDKEGLK